MSNPATTPPKLDYFVHESAYVDRPCSIGRGSQIWHFSHVMPDVKLGDNCKIGQNVFIAAGVQIGHNVKIQNNVSIYAGVTLEDDVFCGPSCVFTNINTPRSAVPRNTAEHYLTTVVRQGASIGANATIVCGHTIGRYAFIGAGSTVTKDVPDYALVYGNPAQQAGWICECGAKLSDFVETTVCQACARHYHYDSPSQITQLQSPA
jgi:UDP-2-acetamido-3-amino-2,3-dideoxy-glucuronate N-acetyltransferase